MKRFLIFLALCLAATAASAQTVIREKVIFYSVAPTVDTNAYTAGDDIGGALTFTTTFCGGLSNAGKIQSVIIADRSANAVDYDLVLSRSAMTSTTITDQAAFDPADSDLPKILPVIRVEDTDRFNFSDNSVSSLSSLESGMYISTTGGTLYGALVTQGTPTYASASDLTVTIGVICN